MYNEDNLMNAIKSYYRAFIGDDYTEDEVDELLDMLDFHALLQVIRHRAQTVHAFTAQGEASDSFNYRGSELFDQRATMLYEDVDQSCSCGVLAVRSYELWLLEDMSFEAVVCFSVNVGSDEYVTEYRERCRDLWDNPLLVDLHELTDELNRMCEDAYENAIPVYEL